MAVATRSGNERRGPERHRVMVALLRRVAGYSLGLAAVLVALPWALTEAGLLGPDATERLVSVRQALQVARTYGGTADLPQMAAAERQLAVAETLQQAGRNREARHAAAEALRLASEAQQAALARREATRLQAKAAIEELDRRIDELEDIYSAVTPRLPRPRGKELFSRMKLARATAAELVLAYEQSDWSKVVTGLPGARAVLDATKAELQGAKPDATPAGAS